MTLADMILKIKNADKLTEDEIREKWKQGFLKVCEFAFDAPEGFDRIITQACEWLNNYNEIEEFTSDDYDDLNFFDTILLEQQINDYIEVKIYLLDPEEEDRRKKEAEERAREIEKRQRIGKLLQEEGDNLTREYYQKIRSLPQSERSIIAQLMQCRRRKKSFKNGETVEERRERLLKLLSNSQIYYDLIQIREKQEIMIQEAKAIWECAACGHIWLARIEEPSVCPKCKNPRYIHKIETNSDD